MYSIFLIMAPLAFIIAGSALVQRLKKLPPSWRTVLNAFALYVGLPTLIFAALVKVDLRDPATEFVPLVLINSAIVLGSMFLMWLFTKIFQVKQPLARTMVLCFSFGNIAYLGIPLLTRMTSEDFLPAISIIVAVYLFWVFTVGIWYLEQGSVGVENTVKDIARRVFLNPLLLAVFAGLVVAGFRIPMPEVVMQTVQMLSAAVTPLVLVVIGLFIGQAPMGKAREWIPAVFFSLAKILVMPGLLFLVLLLLRNYSWVSWVPVQVFSIMEAAMPVAITPFALADRYHLDKKFIAQVVVLSTIMSFVVFTLVLL